MLNFGNALTNSIHQCSIGSGICWAFFHIFLQGGTTLLRQSRSILKMLRDLNFTKIWLCSKFYQKIKETSNLLCLSQRYFEKTNGNLEHTKKWDFETHFVTVSTKNWTCLSSLPRGIWLAHWTQRVLPREDSLSEKDSVVDSKILLYLRVRTPSNKIIFPEYMVLFVSIAMQSDYLEYLRKPKTNTLYRVHLADKSRFHKRDDLISAHLLGLMSCPTWLDSTESVLAAPSHAISLSISWPDKPD